MIGKDSDYEQFLMKEYEYWKVYIHKSQYYLGRLYIWAKRNDADADLFDMRKGEREELFHAVGPAVKNALREFSQPDMFNISHSSK